MMLEIPKNAKIAKDFKFKFEILNFKSCELGLLK